MARALAAAPQAAAGGRRVRAKRVGGVPGWLAGLLCGAGLTLAPAFVIVLGVLLLPGLLARLLDRAEGRPAARAMLLFGGCGCVGPLDQMWAQVRGGAAGERAASVAGSVLGSPDVLAAAWLAAGGGWLLCELAPIVARAILDGAEIRRSARLRAVRARYDEEWEIRE